MLFLEYELLVSYLLLSDKFQRVLIAWKKTSEMRSVGIISCKAQLEGCLWGALSRIDSVVVGFQGVIQSIY